MRLLAFTLAGVLLITWTSIHSVRRITAIQLWSDLGGSVLRHADVGVDLM